MIHQGEQYNEHEDTVISPLNRDFKIQYGEALVRQKCERLLPVTSLVNVPARFPAVARLSGAANMASWRSVHYVSKLLYFYRIFTG